MRIRHTSRAIYTEPQQAKLRHPCTEGAHTWAWLVSGGIACAVCGVRAR